MPGLVVSPPVSPGLVVSPITPGEVVSPIVLEVAAPVPSRSDRTSSQLRIVSMSLFLS